MTRRPSLYAIRAQSDPPHALSHHGVVCRHHNALFRFPFRMFQTARVQCPFRRLYSQALVAALCCLTLLGCCSATVFAATAFSFDSSPLKKRAVQLLDEGRFFECADAWGTVYTFSPLPADRAEALVRTADVYALFLDMPDKALETYADAIRAFRGRPELENAYFNAGMILYEKGQYAQARVYFQSYIDTFLHGSRRSTAEFMLERLRDDMTAGRAAPSDGTVPIQQGEREPNVRVAIASAAAVSFALVGDVTVAGRGVLRAGAYSITAAGNSLLLNGQPVGSQLTFSLPAAGRLRMGDAEYEGGLTFQIAGGRVLVVNAVNLERYLEGVLPSEMPSSFNGLALQAQAIAARSYAMYLMGKTQDKPYDVSGSTASQVYGGVGVGNIRTRSAVVQTRGRVLTYAGKIALAYFHSHSGGMLEDDRLVWPADMPYYVVQDDSVSNRAHAMHWQATLSAYDVIRHLRENGFTVSAVNAVRAGSLSSSGRMATVVVETPDRILEIKANAFRLMMGPELVKSTLCTVQRRGDVFIFAGSGFGHGVGMSQWGAQGMAQEGRSVSEILDHYYPGTRLVTVY